MPESENAIEKLAEASRLIKEAGRLLEDTGLEIDFEIKIKAQRPRMGVSFMEEPGKNPPPSKKD
jgi:hypothetical protein